jgi:hypothetical protein
MYCVACGKQINDQAIVCVGCGVATRGNRANSSVDRQVTRMLLPIDRSGYAVAAGYLGLFCFLLPVGILAVIFGHLGLRDINKNPQKCGAGRAIFGIIMGILNTLIYLAAILLPYFK